MIVVDATILIYSLIECEYTPLTQQLRSKDADWRTAGLCLHEILNVLTTYQRRNLLTLPQCHTLLEHAHRFVQVAQQDVALDVALVVAAQYTITGYDAQYVALAQSLKVPLITEDRKLCQATTGISMSLQDFLQRA